MSISDSTVKGKFDELAGKVKQGVGEAFNDQSLANRGAGQEVKGHAEQAWGGVKEGVHDATTPHTDTTYAAERDTEVAAHNTRSGVTHVAEDIKDGVRDLFKGRP